MEEIGQLCYNHTEADKQYLRQELIRKVLMLSDDQAKTLWRWLLCSRQENS